MASILAKPYQSAPSRCLFEFNDFKRIFILIVPKALADVLFQTTSFISSYLAITESFHYDLLPPYLPTYSPHSRSPALPRPPSLLSKPGQVAMAVLEAVTVYF